MPSHLLHPDTLDAYHHAVTRAHHHLTHALHGSTVPQPRHSVATLTDAVKAIDLTTPLGSVDHALDELTHLYLNHAVWFHDEQYAAHLNCPVSIPALAADVLISAVNSSMDTWDQSTAATAIERSLLDWTATALGLTNGADGVVTSGGTQSNFQALLVARYHSGIAPHDLHRGRVLATANSHFSVTTATRHLGLGNDAVIAVDTDAEGRMDPSSLDLTLSRLLAHHHLPIAVVATAGTTDRGCVDPLDALADVCARHGVWLHVDAAVGAGLALTQRRHLVRGIDRASSITVDYHKTFYQPISASAVLVTVPGAMDALTFHADYLNPEHDERPNLVDHSLQTTRRCDALKVWLTLRTVGGAQIGRDLDACLDTLQELPSAMAALADWELHGRPHTFMALFRYAPPGLSPADRDALNLGLRERLYLSGRGAVASTTVDGQVWLKFTVLNPRTTLGVLCELLERLDGWAREMRDTVDAASSRELVA